MPILGLLALSPDKLATFTTADFHASTGAATISGDRATVPLTFSGPLLAKPAALVVLMQRDDLWWRVVGLLNSGALLDAL